MDTNDKTLHMRIKRVRKEIEGIEVIHRFMRKAGLPSNKEEVIVRIKDELVELEREVN